MPLIKSISGIRGTIGGKPGAALTPVDIVKFTAAYATWIKKNYAKNTTPKIVVGRDGRISGEMVQQLVIATLRAVGADVVNLELSTTPTVEMGVIFEKAAGGIILTASHNPKEWNALKLLNADGEFLSAANGEEVLAIAEKEAFDFVSVDKLGKVTTDKTILAKHIEAVVKHPLVKADAIQKRNFKIVVDGINSTGAIAVPELLKTLGVKEQNIVVINGEVNGEFAHNPEPLPEHLIGLCETVKKQKADLGIAVDPDVDRLCFVCEDGSMFGEEYTLVAVADYVLQHKKGNTVSNMSSTRALRDITEKAGGEYFASAVGEVNVVNKMKAVNAVIGGEGNGGVIVPDLHYGRDSLIGIALFLSLLTKHKSAKLLRSQYPNYFISKNKIKLSEGMNISKILKQIALKYKNNPINKEDGLKIEFDKDWVHLRASNTEPIIRIYAESASPTTADNIAKRIVNDIKEAI
jgi:phosphomannomutase